MAADRAADLGGTFRHEMEPLCEISNFFGFLYIHKLMILCQFTEIVEKPRFSLHFHLPRRRVVADRAADGGGTTRPRREYLCEISDFSDLLLMPLSMTRRTAYGGRTLQKWNLDMLKRILAKFQPKKIFFFKTDYIGVLFRE